MTIGYNCVGFTGDDAADTVLNFASMRWMRLSVRTLTAIGSLFRLAWG